MHLIRGFGRQRLPMLHQARHNHPHYFLNVLESFLLGVAPSGAALPHQDGAVCVPALPIRLYHDPEIIGFQLVFACSQCATFRPGDV